MKKIYIIKDIITGHYYTSLYTYFSEDIIDADEFDELEEAEWKIGYAIPNGKYTIETVYIVTD